MILLIIVLIVEVIIGIALRILDYWDIPSVKKRYCIVSIIAIIISGFCNFLEMPIHSPSIGVTSGNEFIVIESNNSYAQIEYKTSADGSWKKYTEPFVISESAVIYAKCDAFHFIESGVNQTAVYVAENGLLYTAEKPNESLRKIEAEYIYIDPEINKKPGNHYVGYEINKADIMVTGTDLNGITSIPVEDFDYNPKVIKHGENIITISYEIAKGHNITTHFNVYGDEPALIKIEAKYKGTNTYVGDNISPNMFDVYGIFENGIRKKVNGYAITPTVMGEGINVVTVYKNDLSESVEVTAIKVDDITENERERNDDIGNANSIKTNLVYSGKLENEEDIDYYKTIVDSKGSAQIKFEHTKMDDESIFWQADLLSESEETIVHLDVIGSKTESLSSKARISPGLYYLRINHNYFSDSDYRFTLLYDLENDSFETEPNDDISKSAMGIEVNKSYIGNITNESDEDYYTFEIKKKGKVSITFNHDKINEDSWFWEIRLLDESNVVTKMYSSGGEVKSQTDNVRLPAGIYYVSISKYYWKDIDYSFSVAYQKESDGYEEEPNDDYNVANDVSIGNYISGNLQSDQDIDFYKFELNQQSDIVVQFNHSKIDDGSYYWRLDLIGTDSSDALENDEGQNHIYICGDSPESLSSRWKNMYSGTYYIKVTRENYNNEDYSIAVFQ